MSLQRMVSKFIYAVRCIIFVEGLSILISAIMYLIFGGVASRVFGAGDYSFGLGDTGIILIGSIAIFPFIFGNSKKNGLL